MLFRSCQNSPRVSFSCPLTDFPPTRNVGAFDNGSANDALINIRVSLTVGKRCRTRPWSQDVAGGVLSR